MKELAPAAVTGLYNDKIIRKNTVWKVYHIILIVVGLPLYCNFIDLFVNPINHCKMNERNLDLYLYFLKNAFFTLLSVFLTSSLYSELIISLFLVTCIFKVISHNQQVQHPASGWETEYSSAHRPKHCSAAGSGQSSGSTHWRTFSRWCTRLHLNWGHFIYRNNSIFLIHSENAIINRFDSHLEFELICYLKFFK